MLDVSIHLTRDRVIKGQELLHCDRFSPISPNCGPSEIHPSAPFSRWISCGFKPDRQHRRDSPRL